MNTLFIAEKKELGEAIANALPGVGKREHETIRKGNNTVVWCAGHMLTLQDPKDIDAEKYGHWSMEQLPLYFNPWPNKVVETTSGSKAARVVQIGKLIKEADVVVNCGDIDEEGQLLIDELLRWFHYTGPVKRLDTSNTALAGMQKALGRMKDNRECELDGWSAFGRSLADKIFGYNLTQYYTLKNNGTLLSVGRVQTPTLGLVVSRDRLIEGHAKQKYYELYSDGTLKGKRFQLKYSSDKDNAALIDGKFLSKDYLEKLAQALYDTDFTAKVEKETVKEAPPLPFNLIALNTYCNQKWNMNPSEVMAITQSLRGNYSAITYNRSDCQYLSEEHFKEAPATIDQTCNNLSYQPGVFDSSIHSRCFNDDNITAHFAIIPSGGAVNIGDMSKQEQLVYTAICEYYLAQFMPPCEKLKTTITVSLPDSGKLAASSSKIINPGFYYLLKELKEDGDDTEEMDFYSLPAGNYLYHCDNTKIEERETRPPKRYTQATLFNDMTRISKFVDDEKVRELLLAKDKGKKGENGSIGTSATRDSIIMTLIKRGYLEEKQEGKKTILISTEKGREFYDMLPDNIKKADTTAYWWIIQEDIKSGKATPQTLAESVLKIVREIIASGQGGGLTTATTSSGKYEPICECPRCGGKVMEGSKGYYCSNYKNGCELKGLWKNACWTTIGREDVKELLAGNTILKSVKAKTGKRYKKKLQYDMEKGKIYICK